MIPLKEDTLYDWLESAQAFSYDFKAYCFQNFRVFGLSAEFSKGKIDDIHARWVSGCEDLLANSCHTSTTDLSPSKILAILLSLLVTERFLDGVFVYEYSDESELVFVGSPTQYTEARQSLIDGQELVLAFDFIFHVFAWYKENSSANIANARIKFNAAMRHDFLNYLSSGDVDHRAIYLILKALSLVTVCP